MMCMLQSPSTNSSPRSSSSSSLPSPSSERIFPFAEMDRNDERLLVPSHQVHENDVLMLVPPPSPALQVTASLMEDPLIETHLGNRHYRMLVHSNLDLHRQLSSSSSTSASSSSRRKRQQHLLCRSMVLAVQAQNPPGRFLAPTRESDVDASFDANGYDHVVGWREVDESVAIRATSRMFQVALEEEPRRTKRARMEEDGK